MQRFPGLTPPGWARSQAFTVSEREGPLAALLLCQAKGFRAMEERLLAGSLKVFKTYCSSLLYW